MDSATYTSHVHRAVGIYRHWCPPGDVDLWGAETAGMIAKGDLIDGHTYIGYCRNATEAQWVAAIGRFRYVRRKFGSHFAATIPHPADDDRQDVFVPVVDLADTLEDKYA